MSFALHAPRVILGDGLRDRLRALLGGVVDNKPVTLAEVRKDETDQACRRALDRKRERGTVVGDALAERQVAVQRAHASALAAEHRAGVVTQLSLMHQEAPPERVQAMSVALAEVRATAATAQAQAEQHAKLANEATERCLRAVPAEEVAHVGALFDEIVDAGIEALVASARFLEAHGVVAMRCEIGGHVEDAGAPEGAPGLMTVGLWPVR